MLQISIHTSLMGMEQVSMESLHPIGTSSEDRGKISVNWSWHKEDVGIWGENKFSTHILLEKLNTILDKSYYLWYTIRYYELIINFAFETRGDYDTLPQIFFQLGSWFLWKFTNYCYRILSQKKFPVISISCLLAFSSLWLLSRYIFIKKFHSILISTQI